MKYALILGDGMGDYPIPSLGGRTPLEVADKPCMNALAKTGKVGLVKTVPDGYKPGSDVANLGALGYDATKCYTGRSPLEALSIGIDMKEDDVALRMNLVTLGDEENFEDKTMRDYSAGEITTAESRELVLFLQKELGGGSFTFYPGVSYRHCLIIAHGSTDMQLTPPHDISGKRIGEYLPKGDRAAELNGFIRRSYELLSQHPINKKRVLSGKNPANSSRATTFNGRRACLFPWLCPYPDHETTENGKTRLYAAFCFAWLVSGARDAYICRAVGVSLEAAAQGVKERHG